METEIKVQGMHCEACNALVKMEIEELGLDSKVKKVELQENNKGKITLIDIEDEEKEEIIESINNMENYEVIE